MKTILILEDNADDAFLLSRALQYADADYYTEFVRDGTQGITYLEAYPPFEHRKMPDLILVDLGMPGLGGYEFIHWLRSESRFDHIPALILTDQINPNGEAEAKRLRAQGYFVKPGTQDALYQIVKEIERLWLGKP